MPDNKPDIYYCRNQYHAAWLTLFHPEDFIGESVHEINGKVYMSYDFQGWEKHDKLIKEKYTGSIFEAYATQVNTFYRKGIRAKNNYHQ